MELKVQNFDKFIQDQCKIIIDSASNLGPLFKSYDFAEKSKIDRQIVKMTLAVQQIYSLAFPIPGSGEFHGLPKEITEAADDPDILVVDSENPGWDFGPWFRQKVSMTKKASNHLLEYYEKDPTELKVAPNSGTTPKKFIMWMLEHHLKSIKAYAEAILSMFESSRLKVRDVRLEEEED